MSVTIFELVHYFEIVVRFAVNFTTMTENLQIYRFLEKYLSNATSKKLLILTDT